MQSRTYSLGLALIRLCVVCGEGEDLPVVPQGEKRFEVKIVAGPEQCDEIDKAREKRWIGVHYTGSSDESTEHGDKGAIFDDSRKHITLTHDEYYFQLSDGRHEEYYDEESFLQERSSNKVGWDLGLAGKCKGATIEIIMNAQARHDHNLGYDHQSNLGPTVHHLATIKWLIEIKYVSEDGLPEPTKNLFAVIDTNKDGKLTLEEIAANFNAKPEPGIAADFSLGNDEEGREKARRTLELDDRNQDGFVTWDEFSGPKGLGEEEL